MEIIVPDDQLSLAIGKKRPERPSGLSFDSLAALMSAQNPRLSWNAHARWSRLTSVSGIGDLTAELLYQQGL